MTGIWTPLPSLADLFAQLRETPEPYDPDLLAARRSGFVEQIQQRNADPVNDDPDDANWIKTPPMTYGQDARNSRPEPW